ncbi:C_GCAxxG_C_C family probable redox protein [Desulfacinum infernum DSM 9756]|uniref:C_GCAxxG_C_C family probable redox protein n=1 Tax=Desulfacinum infernum DSM 9756 TaxID=1121391 RepID=A0A1M4XT81_9BACT|nr:C-GCAxxG-C-C family protein [Desulfacinum infernum]SHE96600.1 C_GCAxxG_C_C family probable redox protein [Desulfacinum infernum DSM 9756]
MKTRSAGTVSDLPELFRKKSENLYRHHRWYCSEAVLLTFNRAFGCELPDEVVVGLASGLPEGLGGSGCVCGAVSGAAVALGLVVGAAKGLRSRKDVRAAVAELHERFKEQFGATCCRTLTRKVRHDPKLHFDHCAGVTGAAAELAVRILLEQWPELARRANKGYLRKTEGALSGRLKKAALLLP